MDQNLPTYSARLAYPPGLDETRLAVYDGEALIAETTWRASGNYRPGPAKWDYELHRLGYSRTSPWRPDELGFACNVEPIIRAPGMVPGS